MQCDEFDLSLVCLICLQSDTETKNMIVISKHGDVFSENLINKLAEQYLWWFCHKLLVMIKYRYTTFPAVN